MFIFFWKKMMKMLHALRAKGSSRHARAHHLTSIFKKFSGGGPPDPPSGRGVSPPATSPARHCVPRFAYNYSNPSYAPDSITVLQIKSAGMPIIKD